MMSFFNTAAQVERLRKHFIKTCPKSPFNRDSKEYEVLMECITAPPVEHKKKSFAGNNFSINPFYSSIC